MSSNYKTKSFKIPKVLELEMQKKIISSGYGLRGKSKWICAMIVSFLNFPDDEFIFDSIDLNQGKARMIGNNGSSDVTVDAFLEAIHFTEHTVSGTRNTTSIFDKSVHDKGKTKFLAVYSRHTSMLYFSQYYGKCELWN